jgi:hypothetical protein
MLWFFEIKSKRRREFTSENNRVIDCSISICETPQRPVVLTCDSLTASEKSCVSQGQHKT